MPLISRAILHQKHGHEARSNTMVARFGAALIFDK